MESVSITQTIQDQSITNEIKIDGEKGKSWLTTSEEQAPSAKMDKEEIFKRSQRKSNIRDVAHNDQQNSMIEEIGELSKAINLDELDKR